VRVWGEARATDVTQVQYSLADCVAQLAERRSLASELTLSCA